MIGGGAPRFCGGSLRGAAAPSVLNLIPVLRRFRFRFKELEAGSGSFGSVLTLGSAGSSSVSGSGAEHVWFPVPDSVRKLPENNEKGWSSLSFCWFPLGAQPFVWGCIGKIETRGK